MGPAFNAGARQCGDAREVKAVWLALGPALNASSARYARIRSRRSRLTGFECRSSYFSRRYTYFGRKLGQGGDTHGKLGDTRREFIHADLEEKKDAEGERAYMENDE